MGGHWSDGATHRYTDGLWQYDYGSDTWTILDESPSLPSRYWHTFSYNTDNGEATVFSGSPGNGNYLQDTWILDAVTETWRQVDSETSPPSRICSTAVYDPLNGVTLIFGGRTEMVYMDDIWALDSSDQWSQMTVERSPIEPDGIPGYSILSILLKIALITQVSLRKRLRYRPR